MTEDRKPGGHGNHWGAFAGSDSEVSSLVIGTIDKPASTESLKRGDQEIAAYFSEGEHLRTCVIAIDGEIWTAYPFIAGGVVHEVKIKEVEEWVNGIEAQINGGLEDAGIAFFDSMYFKNKDAYMAGKKYRFSLSAVAYALSRAESRIIRDIEGMKFSTERLAGYFLYRHGDIDDLLFQTPVKDVSKIKFGGKKVYRIRAALFRADYGARDVDIYIYASEKAVKGYVPQGRRGHREVLWLQGYLTGNK